jgi:hypothetical protein
MAVRADIAMPDPAIIGARFLGTVMAMGFCRSGAPALGGDQERRCRWELVDVLLALLTGFAVGPFGGMVGIHAISDHSGGHPER